MRMILTLLLPIPLLLACASAEDGNDGQSEPTQSDGGAGVPEALEAVPAEFQGEWDFAEEDCVVEHSEMRLSLTARSVEYYESSAGLSDIMRNGARTITATHAFSGEGEEWEETLAYELNSSGDRLTVTGEDGSMSIRLRCP